MGPNVSLRFRSASMPTWPTTVGSTQRPVGMPARVPPPARTTPPARPLGRLHLRLADNLLRSGGVSRARTAS
jgi:hypothetical protein